MLLFSDVVARILAFTTIYIKIYTVHIYLSYLVGEEGDEDGDVGDAAEAGQAAVQHDQGVLGGNR